MVDIFIENVISNVHNLENHTAVCVAIVCLVKRAFICLDLQLLMHLFSNGVTWVMRLALILMCGLADVVVCLSISLL